MKKYLFPILLFLLLFIQPIGSLSNAIRNEQVPLNVKNNPTKELPVIDNRQTWMKIYGGMESDEASAIYQTTDSGYIIVGTTYSYGSGIGRNAWLLKLDKYGNEEWNHTYGGTYSEDGKHVQQTSDGGYVVIGWTDSFNVDDLFLVKTDAFGNEEWHRTFGGPNHDYGYYVLETEDGGYLLLGSTESYGDGSSVVLLIKTDSQGVELWNKTIGTSTNEVCYRMHRTDDNGYILVGTRVSDILVVKTDNQGNEEWNKTYNGFAGCDIQSSSDGGYFILGYDPYNDTYGWCSIILRTDSKGNVLWNKLYEKMDFCSFQTTSDDGFVMIGETESLLRENEILLTKTNENGVIQWSRTYGTRNTDWGDHVQQTNDGGYVIVGGTHPPPPKSWYDIIVIKTNERGRIPYFANPCRLIDSIMSKFFQILK